jgi:hypothetical protein
MRENLKVCGWTEALDEAVLSARRGMEEARLKDAAESKVAQA